MAATPDITLKVGDTLIADCVYRDANGNPVNLDTAGITIKSAVVYPAGGNITRVDLEVIPANQATNPGEYRIRGDTKGWPAGAVKWDVRYTRGADSFSSRTINIMLLGPIT